MNSKEIKENFIYGSEVYLKYLIDNDLGIEKISVDGLANENNKVFFLNLSRKLYDSFGFEIEIKGKRYTEEDFSVKNFTPGTKKLTVEFDEFILGDINKKDVFVLVDMRFLVQRVIKWYKSFGENIEFPEQMPKIKYEDCLCEDIKPSNCQEKAIKTVFSQPFSYIWGAPGTGKTKFVLANCILNYLKNDKDEGIIFVTAPTNAALDQTLSGILPVLESASDKLHIKLHGVNGKS